MHKIQIAPRAEADISGISEYFETRNPEIAEKMLTSFNSMFKLILKNMNLGKSQGELLENLRSIPHKRYLIFYRPVKNGIEIYRILHDVRDIESAINEDF